MEYIEQSPMSSTCEDEKTPERLESSQEGSVTSEWARLPYVILTEVFDMLDKKDRINASIVCTNWREHYFHPRWWSSMEFTLHPGEFEKTEFLIETFGPTVKNAKIILKSVSVQCLIELISLLQNLSRNVNLKDLDIEYVSDEEQPLSFFQDENRSSFLDEVANLLNMCLPKLSRLAVNCIGVLSLCEKTIIENLNPSLVRSLELSYITSIFTRNKLDLSLLKQLQKLEELYVDDNSVTGEFLELGKSCAALTTVVVNNRHHPAARYFDHPSAALRKIHNFQKFIWSHGIKHRISTGTTVKEFIVKHVLLC